MFFVLGIFLIYSLDRVSAASENKEGSGDSIQELKTRVNKLEMQVAALQKEIQSLASRPSPNVLTLPGSQFFPGNKIPPGAKEHEINGIKYWTIPLKEK